jgi:hypothetical protein
MYRDEGTRSVINTARPGVLVVARERAWVSRPTDRVQGDGALGLDNGTKVGGRGRRLDGVGRTRLGVR